MKDRHAGVTEQTFGEAVIGVIEFVLLLATVVSHQGYV